MSENGNIEQPKSRISRLVPTIEEFEKVLAQTNGNLTNAAKMLGVTRVTIWHWSKKDKQFDEAISNSRKSLLDKCLTTAQLLAMGIPRLDKDNKIVGWEERPDGNMLRYFMSTLGKDEGFGERLDITSNNQQLTSIVAVNLDNYTPEQRKVMLELARKMDDDTNV